MSYAKKIKIIFIGTPEFAVPSLKALAADKFFEILAVITQPDMPAGRGKKIVPPPIKITSFDLSLQLFQPQKINEVSKKIVELQPDLIIVIAYSQLIPKEILDIPKFGCLNLHASLLPKYRGAAVISAAILNEDKETGVTIIKMNEKLDKGPIIAQVKLKIKQDDTTGSLSNKLSVLGAELLIPIIKKYIIGKIKPRLQDEKEASFIKEIKKSDGLIDWSKTANYLERFIRAMSPWPSAWTWWNGKQIKIISAQKQTLAINSYKSGKVFIYNCGLTIQCGKDALIIKRLQLEGKKELSSQDFLRGQRDFVGAVLG